MRKWWKVLGLSAAGLAASVGSASAQFPPPGGMMGSPPGMMGPPPGMGAGPGMMGPPPGMMGPGPGMMGPGPGMMGPAPGMGPGPGMMLPGMPGPAPGMPTAGGGTPPGAFGGMPPGAFGGDVPGGMPAEFPNPAQPSQEPVSPFSLKEDGNPNAFSELCSPPAHTQPYCLTFRGEYLGWHISNGPLAVPLVTTTSSPGFSSVGQLGNAGTSVLLGAGNNVDYGWNSGFRLTTGVAIGYLPPVEVTGFYMHSTSTVFSAGSLTNPSQFLAIPIQDVQPGLIIPGTSVGTESAVVVSVPKGSALGTQGGTISITSEMSLWGVEANVFVPLTDPTSAFQLSLIGGYRHLQLDETLNIATVTGGNAAGVTFNGLTQPANVFTTSTLDSFGTTNAFDGGQFGLRGVLTWGRWSLFSDFKLALGENTETLSINGSSTLSQNVAGRSSQTAPGGILALPSNSGLFTDRQFAVVPEVNFTLSYQVCSAVRIFGGYDFLYWSRVTRPGDALNNVIDSRQIPTSANFTSGVNYNGPAAPSQISQRSFIANGINLGIEIGF